MYKSACKGIHWLKEFQGNLIIGSINLTVFDLSHGGAVTYLCVCQFNHDWFRQMFVSIVRNGDLLLQPLESQFTELGSKCSGFHNRKCTVHTSCSCILNFSSTINFVSISFYMHNNIRNRVPEHLFIMAILHDLFYIRYWNFRLYISHPAIFGHLVWIKQQLKTI